MVLALLLNVCLGKTAALVEPGELVRNTELSGGNSGLTADLLNQNLHLTTDNLLNHSLKHCKAIPINKNLRENEKKKEVVRAIILAIS